MYGKKVEEKTGPWTILSRFHICFVFLVTAKIWDVQNHSALVSDHFTFRPKRNTILRHDHKQQKTRIATTWWVFRSFNFILTFEDFLYWDILLKLFVVWNRFKWCLCWFQVSGVCYCSEISILIRFCDILLTIFSSQRKSTQFHL